jgi:hypothetical protein
MLIISILSVSFLLIAFGSKGATTLVSFLYALNDLVKPEQLQEVQANVQKREEVRKVKLVGGITSVIESVAVD